MMELSFKDFKKHINVVRVLISLQDNIDKAGAVFYKSDIRDEFHFYYPTGVSEIVELLSIIMNDTEEWIDDWVFELDCGKRAADLPRTDENGKIIPMATVEDLWNVLHKNVADNGNR